jgi:peptidoglycan hydrolase-like protein with peptidoglycan-binding domain
MYIRILTVVLLLLSLSATPLVSHADDAIHELQVKLTELGYKPGPIDGLWGKSTEQALKAFQKDRGLPETGLFDENAAKALGILTPVQPKEAQHALGNDTTKYLHDSMLLKMLLLDLQYDVLGMDWSDRKRFGLPSHQDFVSKLRGLSTKYKISLDEQLNNRKVWLDLPPKRGHGHYESGKAMIATDLPDIWYEIVHFEDWGRLPIVKCKNGSVVLDINKLTIYFSKGTICLVGGKEYEYGISQWIKR